MTRSAAIALSLIAAASAAFDSSPLAAQAGGWTMLFDGKTLQGWNMVGDANWEVVDGAVQASRGSGFLVTPMSYGDFQITLEFWVDDDANSGVFMRCSDLKMINAMTAYEAQIFDKRPDPTYRTGSLVFVSKPTAMINTGGKWNTYDITAQGSRLMVTLNGTRTVDVQDTKHARGPIALQRTAGIVRFRNVRIRTL